MLRWMTKILDRLGSPELDWIQVEVSSRCNAACTYCPQPLLYKKEHMPLELFKKLLPYLGYTNLVYLQGWGEPLINPDLFAMIRLCKKKGKRVGFTTNGMLLNEETILKLVDLETDIISVSLAGTTPETHNRIRKGTDFNKIIENLELLRQIKSQKKTAFPDLHFAYLMLVSNFHELKGAVGLGKRVGAKQIVCSNLTFIIDEALCPEAFFVREEERKRFADALYDITEEARGENLLFAFPNPLFQKQPANCSENVCLSCVVSVTGEVSPCVFTSPTLLQADSRARCKPLTHIYQNIPLPCYPLSFGNITDDSLTGIWNKKKYHRFRKIHYPDVTKPGISRMSLPQSCASCYKKEA
jgi:MoaA/NifB/PqqE/SkfB family radical SAM enzyme